MFVRAAAFGLLALSLAAVVKANVEVLDDESFTALVEVRFFQDAQSALAGLPSPTPPPISTARNIGVQLRARQRNQCLLLLLFICCVH